MTASTLLRQDYQPLYMFHFGAADVVMLLGDLIVTVISTSAVKILFQHFLKGGTQC